MPLLDVEKLCAAVSPEQPAGSDLEYDPAFLELEQAARGKEGLYNPVSKQVEGGEEPDWARVRELAIELFGRTKDLRVAVHLCGALLRIGGLPGLAEGLALIARLLELYWSNVHPPLVAEENNDPIDRVNALENLSSADGLLKYLREAILVEARGLGRFTLRDLDLAEGRANPRENETVPTLALLQGAWNEGDPESNAARRTAVGAILGQLKHIQGIFDELAGAAPDLNEIARVLRPAQVFYEGVAPAPAAGAEAEQVEEGAAVEAGAGPVTRARPAGPLATRADALKLLRQISDFVKQNEPSSPAPIFIDRAIKLMEMGFVDIVRELMPDARDRIELIGGIKFDDKK